MTQRLRNSEIAIFCAFVLFSMAWLPLQGIRDPLPLWENAVRPHPEIRAAFVIVQMAGIVAFLAMIVGGLPVLGIVFVRAMRMRRRAVLLSLAVPLLAVALLAVYALLASAAWTQRQQPTPNAPFTLRAVLLQLGLVALIGLAVAASTAAIAVAVARGEPDERALRYAFAPATVATLAMVAGLLGTLALCALTITETPQLRSFGDVPVVLMMGAATVLAMMALRRGMHQRAA
jgi:MFS family permease